MFFRKRLFVAATLLITRTTFAQGDSNSLPPTFDDWIAQSRIVVAGDNANAALYQTPKGIGYDGVGALLIERPDGLFICSGSLLAGGLNVLTAAHCLTDSKGKVIATKVTSVFFPPGQPNSAQEIIAGSAFYVNPQYTGQLVDAHDVAVVSLASSPSQGILNSAYNLFLGNPFGLVGTIVGSGNTGTGAAGEVLLSNGFNLGNRHVATNRVDFSWSDALFGGDGNLFFGPADVYGLVADFDSGLAANDATCILMALYGAGTSRCGLGQGALEGILGGGDSGGPLFINGQIAGVASYGVTFRNGITGDIDNALDGTFGEFSGWTSTDYNQVWLSQFTTATPEPGSFALVGVGLFGVIGFASNRRKRA
ncbi:MAG: trypsin-like serine protease [Gemmatimonadaceae bacterium]